jgi:hypothetical protein
MIATEIVVPTIYAVLFFLVVMIVFGLVLWYFVVVPVLEKYVRPWIWHRLGGKGDPPGSDDYFDDKL